MARDPLATIREKLIEKINQDDLSVPMLPQVAHRVIKLTQDKDSEASDLAKLIESDQTLAGKVMQVANSAAYSPNSSLVSLQQAVTRLGMKLITEIALSASVNTRLFNTPGYEKHIAYLIRHSLASGLWAKEVARACRKNVEAAFLSGLLHGIGRPVAVQSILEICSESQSSLESEQVLALEEEFQHSIGLKVVEQWEMPDSICQSVQYCQNYHYPHAQQLQTMIVVAGALSASHFMCESGNDTQCLQTEELKAQSVFADLNLYPDQVDALLERWDTVKDTLEAMNG